MSKKHLLKLLFRQNIKISAQINIPSQNHIWGRWNIIFLIFTIMIEESYLSPPFLLTFQVTSMLSYIHFFKINSSYILQHKLYYVRCPHVAKNQTGSEKKNDKRLRTHLAKLDKNLKLYVNYCIFRLSLSIVGRGYKANGYGNWFNFVQAGKQMKWLPSDGLWTSSTTSPWKQKGNCHQSIKFFWSF